METGRQRGTGGAGWKPWAIGGAAGIVVMTLVTSLFRSPAQSGRAASRGPVANTAVLAPVGGDASGVAGPRPVGLVPWSGGSADRLLQEETVLRDPTPLFLPTAWNASEPEVAGDLQREPGSGFRNYPPQLVFGDADLRLAFPVTTPVPTNPAGGLALEKPRRPAGGFGEGDMTVASLAARVGVVEVTGAADGRLMLRESLREARPPGEGTWQPLTFLVTIDSTGLVRPPVLTESSRVAAVDEYFQDFLGNGLHIGERLPPGFYRVAIGP